MHPREPREDYSREYAKQVAEAVRGNPDLFAPILLELLAGDIATIALGVTKGVRNG